MGSKGIKKKTLEGRTKHLCVTLWVGSYKDSGSF